MRAHFPPLARSLVTVVALLFFFTPLALWAIGVRPDDQGARASLPSTWTSWGWIDETRAYVEDQLPFRTVAVRWRADVTRELFGEAPPGAGNALDESTPRAGRGPSPIPEGASDVVLGKNRWMFLTGELALACTPERSDPAIADDLRRMAKAVEQSGRAFVLSVAPDKSAVEQEHLPDDNPYEECAARGHRHRFATLHDAGIPGYIDMLQRLRLIERRDERETYLRGDSHWNGLATSELTVAIARSLDPAVIPHTQFEPVEYEYQSDLTRVLGTPVTERGTNVRVLRPGVTVDREDAPFGPNTRAITTRATTVGAPIAPEKILLIGDSFALGIVDQLAPFVQSLTYLHTFDALLDPDLLQRELDASTVVVVVTVERYAAAGITDDLARVLVSAARRAAVPSAR
ncbi:MAG: hypothetical protein WEC34_06050 [Acidimicrobiia bacterium]